MKMVAVAALAEEVGRAALPSPLVATLLATCVLREAKTDTARSWLERIAGGEPATLAITNADGSWEPDATDVKAKAQGDGVILDGTASFVQDARKVSFFVVSARGDAGVGLYVVRADAPGVTIRADHIVDLTRDQARVELRQRHRARVARRRRSGAGGRGAGEGDPGAARPSSRRISAALESGSCRPRRSMRACASSSTGRSASSRR